MLRGRIRVYIVLAQNISRHLGSVMVLWVAMGLNTLPAFYRCVILLQHNTSHKEINGLLTFKCRSLLHNGKHPQNNVSCVKIITQYNGQRLELGLLNPSQSIYTHHSAHSVNFLFHHVQGRGGPTPRAWGWVACDTRPYRPPAQGGSSPAQATLSSDHPSGWPMMGLPSGGPSARDGTSAPGIDYINK